MITIYTDGSYIKADRVGGWAAILVDQNDNEKVVSGGTFHSIHNMEAVSAQRMEVMAVLQGLLALSKPTSVEIVTDSSYVNDTLSKGWLERWVQEGDLSKKHLDLWMMIYNLSKIHSISSRRVKAHAGHYYNERCDTLARENAIAQTNLEEYKEQLNKKGPTLFDMAETHDINSLFQDELPFDNKQSKKDKPKTKVKSSPNKKRNNKDSNKPATRKPPKNGVYAVAKGRKIGIYKTWTECQKQVNKYKGAIFKKFATEDEAQAFIDKNK